MAQVEAPVFWRTLRTSMPLGRHPGPKEIPVVEQVWGSQMKIRENGVILGRWKSLGS